jgi:hypothetical protein
VTTASAVGDEQNRPPTDVNLHARDPVLLRSGSMPAVRSLRGRRAARRPSRLPEAYPFATRGSQVPGDISQHCPERNHVNRAPLIVAAE